MIQIRCNNIVSNPNQLQYLFCLPANISFFYADQGIALCHKAYHNTHMIGLQGPDQSLDAHFLLIIQHIFCPVGLGATTFLTWERLNASPTD